MTAVDPLFGDWYQGDGDPDWARLVAAGPPWHGAIVKATQGAHYDGGAWLQRHWPAIKLAAGDRYGVDFFRGCYHYLDFAQPVQPQLDAFLGAIDRAGGFSYGDLVAVDVERGGQRAMLTASLVRDTTTAIAKGIHEATGIPVMLYGGELIRSLEITDRMGCSFLWTARYAATLPADTYTSMGWPIDELALWQYAGKRDASHVDSYLLGYPTITPAGLADISVLTLPGGLAALRSACCVRRA